MRSDIDRDTEKRVEDEMRAEVQALTTDERQEFFNWITGRVSDPPDVVRGVIINLATKINMVTGYLTSINLMRMNRISEFMQEAEDELFNRERLSNMSTEELSNVYSEAQRVLNSSLDFARKFTSQNKDLGKLEEVDDLYKMLLSLPPSRIRELREILGGGEVNGGKEREGKEREGEEV